MRLIKYLFFFLLVSCFAFAKESSSYTYFRSSGFGLLYEEEFLPGTSFGLGARYRNQELGFGFSANLSYLGLNPYFSIKGEGLYYFQETPSSYFAGGSIEMGHHYQDIWYFLPKGEIFLGKEFINRAEKKCFVSLGIDPFFLLIEDNISPIVALNFGWGF